MDTNIQQFELSKEKPSTTYNNTTEVIYFVYHRITLFIIEVKHFKQRVCTVLYKSLYNNRTPKVTQHLLGSKQYMNS